MTKEETTEARCKAVLAAITYYYTAADDGDGGWINGTAVVDGVNISVGGGWVSSGGTVTPYDSDDDLGDVDDLADALGYDSSDWHTLVALANEVRDACPASWDMSAYAPPCTDRRGHNWTSEDEGGCDENPGVWSVGGTALLFREHCTRCGLRRETLSRGGQRNPDEGDEITYTRADM